MPAPAIPNRAAAAELAAQALRQGLNLALADVSRGRAELAEAVRHYQDLGNRSGCVQGLRVAAAAQLVFMGIADDDDAGFEDAVAIVGAAADPARVVFSNALFPSPWHPEHGARRA